MLLSYQKPFNGKIRTQREHQQIPIHMTVATLSPNEDYTHAITIDSRVVRNTRGGITDCRYCPGTIF